ncbi:hypothetical protein ACJJTC_000885 [Scirpophaga incertulas]
MKPDRKKHVATQAPKGTAEAFLCLLQYPFFTFLLNGWMTNTSQPDLFKVNEWSHYARFNKLKLQRKRFCFAVTQDCGLLKDYIVTLRVTMFVKERWNVVENFEASQSYA